ncbi:unnamed protein product [Closterium sp. NIES-65]|nr:unnamed protein product [Closterium sp. NIES-65]
MSSRSTSGCCGALALLLVVLVLGQGVQGAVAAVDYGDAMAKAILFFEAQRSGQLTGAAIPTTISWRGNSGLSDGTAQGVDLRGGYYEGGSNVKAGLPGAFAATMLAWSLVDFGRHILAAGGTAQLSGARDALRWATDYLIKAHTKPEELWAQVGSSERRWAALGAGGQLWAQVGSSGRRWAALGAGGQLWAQVGGEREKGRGAFGEEGDAGGEREGCRAKWGGKVGDVVTDGACWQRPEDMSTSRTAYRINATRPGSDLAAESAAALAAASLAFRDANASYAASCLAHAQQVFFLHPPAACSILVPPLPSSAIPPHASLLSSSLSSPSTLLSPHSPNQLFVFADKYRGVYSTVVPGAALKFPSTGYTI